MPAKVREREGAVFTIHWSCDRGNSDRVYKIIFILNNYNNRHGCFATGEDKKKPKINARRYNE
jgi:hypothetical protein